MSESPLKIMVAPYNLQAVPWDASVEPLGRASAPRSSLQTTSQIPAYINDHYWWAYLRPASLKVFDNTPVVSAILWGQYARLKEAALEEIQPGQQILQAACVYGDLSPQLAKRVGNEGRLDVIDIVPLQVTNCRRKLRGFPNATVRQANAAVPGGGPYDAVCCFFLLHELPDDCKRIVVNSLLESVVPGGKVIFIDYHKPHFLHPLKAVMSVVFALLEPFAKRLWSNEISYFAENNDQFDWRKRKYFGALFQKVIATRANKVTFMKAGC
ncbi:MAG: rhodoquinone biosynthesis methyltransferase RquA [Haliea sp.]